MEIWLVIKVAFMYVSVCMNNSFDANDAVKRRVVTEQSAVGLVIYCLRSGYNVGPQMS